MSDMSDTVAVGVDGDAVVITLHKKGDLEKTRATLGPIEARRLAEMLNLSAKHLEEDRKGRA